MNLAGKKVLITGATGMVGKPIAESLAAGSEVYAAARFKDPDAKAALESAGVTCVSADLMSGDLSGLPDVDVVIHLGVVKTNKWEKDLDGNAGAVADLMERYQGVEAFLHCSSGGVYKPKGHHAILETDPLGDNHGVMPFMATYSISKISAEAVARWGARRFKIPTVITRLSVPYGDNGGWPHVHLQMMKSGYPIAVSKDQPSQYNPIHTDDMVAMLPTLLDAASVPATTINWGGDEVVAIEDWVAYLTELTGIAANVQPSDEALPSVVVDLTKQAGLGLHSTIPWREGVRRMVATMEPDLLKP